LALGEESFIFADNRFHVLKRTLTVGGRGCQRKADDQRHRKGCKVDQPDNETPRAVVDGVGLA
jgi:hypothetical protein